MLIAVGVEIADHRRIAYQTDHGQCNAGDNAREGLRQQYLADNYQVVAPVACVVSIRPRST